MKNVLIIDNASFMRMTIKLMLEKNGYDTIYEAETGRGGIKKYKQYHPDIVTVDMSMPDMNGIEILSQIKRYNADAKVVMITAMGEENIIRKAVMAGADYFIVKPFEEEILINTLNKLLVG